MRRLEKSAAAATGEPRRPRQDGVVFAFVAVLALATWAYLAWMDWGMRNMGVGADMLLMPRMQAWDAIDLALVFLMWALMMIAMMAPSVVPAAAAVSRVTNATEGTHRLTPSAFVAGYLIAWIAFSVGATLVHWGLLNAALVSPMMESSTPILSGLILIGAGAYQFTPFKRSCLRRCQSPLWILFECSGWSVTDALKGGVRLGAFCVGCCWALMALLFVLGVMNLTWVLVLAIYVLVEKSMPHHAWIPWLAGIALMSWGLWLLAR